MSAPTVVGTPTSGGQASGTTVATSFSTGWAANDVAYIFLWQSGTAVPTTPTGWTLAASQTAGNPRCWVYRRVLQSGDTAPTITVSNVVHNWGVVILHGANTTTPEDGTNNNFNAVTASTIVALGVTTAVATDYLLTSFGNNASQSGTPPAGTELLDITTNGTAAFQLNGETLSSAGATGTRTETLAGNGGNEGSITIAVRGTTSTTFTKSVSGSVSSSGAITKQANKFGGNVLANPGAEDGTSGWSGGGWGIVNLDATHPHSGSTAFLLQSGVPSGAGDMALVSGYIPVVAGQLVHGEAWVRATGTGRVAYIEYEFWNAAQNAIVATLDGPQITDSATYQQLTYEAVTPSGVGAAYVQMWVWFKNCPQNETHDIDDLVLKLPASIGPAGVLTRRPGKAVGTPQLPNPGFESGTTGWSPSAFCTLSVDTTNFRSGSQSLLLTSTLTGDIFAESDLLGGFASGQAVHAEAWVKAHSSTNLATIEIWYYDSSGAFVAKENGASVTDSTTGWTRVSYDSAAPTGTAAVKIRIGFSAVAVGNTKNIDDAILTTGVGLSGALARRAGKLLAGAVASSGVVKRQDNKGLAGTVTSSGAVGRSLARSVSGAITSNGTVIRSIARNVSGQIASSGISTRSLGRQLAGSVTSNGTFAYSITRVLAISGSISSTGDLVRQVGKVLAGSSTVGAGRGLQEITGVLTLQLNKSFTGAVSSVGALVRQSNDSFAGAVSSSGSLAQVRTVVLSVAGAVSIQGAYQALVGHLVAGSTAPAGALTNQPGKGFAGTSTPAGALGFVTEKALAGVISSAGSVGRLATLPFEGVISPRGLLVKRITHPFSGSISESGSLILQRGKVMAGSVALAGALVNAPRRTLAGQLSSSGALGRIVRSRLVGEITPSGALVAFRVRLLYLDGALSSVGSLSLQAGSRLAGALSGSGRLSRTLQRALSGESGPSGAITLGVRVTFAGRVDVAGEVARTVGLLLDGNLPASGSLLRGISRTFGGSVAASGSLERAASLSFDGAISFASGVSSRLVTIRPIRFLIGMLEALTRVGELEADLSVAVTDPLLAAGSVEPAIATEVLVEDMRSSGETPTEQLSMLAPTQIVAAEGRNFSIGEDDPVVSVATAEQSVSQETEDVVADTESDLLPVIETDGRA